MYLHSCIFIHVSSFMYLHSCIFIHVSSFMYLHSCIFIHVSSFMYLHSCIQETTAAEVPEIGCNEVGIGCRTRHLCPFQAFKSAAAINDRHSIGELGIDKDHQ